MISLNKHNGVFFIVSMVLIYAGICLTGCTTIPKNFPPLEQAKAAYAKAAATEGINTYAPVELYEARKTLRKAERSENIEEMEHLSYLAERQSQIAIAVTERKIADNETAQLSKKKNKVILEARSREVVKAQAKARQLEEELAELRAKRTSRGIVLTLGDMLFAFGKAELTPGAMLSIDKLVAFLKENSERRILIEGHTDSIGSEEYNRMLSQQRAEAVQMALVSRGISFARITTRGYGESYPVASNATEAGRQQNRRVEVVILNE